MVERPVELRQDIERTRERLDAVATALTERFNERVIATKRNLQPRQVVRHHPVAVGVVVAGLVVSGYMAVRTLGWVARLLRVR